MKKLLYCIVYASVCGGIGYGVIHHLPPTPITTLLQEEFSADIALDQMRADAKAGNAAAQFHLGVAYAVGNGVAENHRAAVRWFRLAADQGIAEAQHNLGVAYATGLGAARNDVLAHMWFNLAAGHGLESSSRNRDIVAEDMTSEEIAIAQQRADAYLARTDEEAE